MHRVLGPAGKKVMLIGNEAIVRGALEAGVGFASTYPGTPASEIGDTFCMIAPELEKRGIYFEYSTNEKCAVEAAAGAAFCGVRSIVSFKQFGFNVASDSIFPLAYTGVRAGMVIVLADDPGCWSSGQSVQDSRLYARIAHMPMLEPADPQECKDMTKLAFDLSEKFKIPTIIRSTTRVSHASASVLLGKIKKGKTAGHFEKGFALRTMPPGMLEVHRELHSKFDEILKYVKGTELNFVINEKSSDLGIITSGVSFCYAMESILALNLKLPVLKLGLTWPLPEDDISSFIKGLRRVLVVEEIDPLLEREVKMIAKGANPELEVHGKDLLPGLCNIKPVDVISALQKLTGLSCQDFAMYRKKFDELSIPKRPPTLCPGCPHRASFWAAKAAAGKECVFGGDIGCYILGIYPPYNTQDWVISMGASEGVAHGIKKVSDHPVIAFVGDSTFLHAGIPALINMVYNNSNLLVIALDNRWTAMTGHQPNPSMGITGMGKHAKEIKIEEVAKACGIEHVAVVNPFNVIETIKKIKEFLKKPSPSLIVSRGECRLQFMRRARKKGIKIPGFEIDQNLCTKCGTCLYEFGCLAIQRKEENYVIDPVECWGCSVCVQICPAKAIKVKK
jgi:indolepyruvate ferredoxin oxidoreductase alpha subunit